jgi:hypothetical protein
MRCRSMEHSFPPCGGRLGWGVGPHLHTINLILSLSKHELAQSPCQPHPSTDKDEGTGVAVTRYSLNPGSSRSARRMIAGQSLPPGG